MLWNALSRQSGVASSPRFLWIKNVFEQRNWRTLRKTFVFVISCLIPKKSLNCTSGQQYVAKIKYPPRLMFRVHSTHMKANVHLNVHPWLSIKKGAEKRMRKDGFWPWVGNGRLRGAGLAWIAAIWQLRPAQRYWLSVCTEGGILPNSSRFVFEPYFLKF